MDIFIGSQNIYDREGKIVACELLYRNSLLNKYDESVSSETASCTIINNIINLGLDIVTGGKIALINCDDKVLRNDIITILPRDKVVIELLETLRPTEGVIKEIKRLKDFGFKLALDDIVDLNGEERQIISGIAMHYKPEELVGKYVVLVANLKPVTLRGELSQGMILAAATDDDSLLNLVNPGELPTGSQVR